MGSNLPLEGPELRRRNRDESLVCSSAHVGVHLHVSLDLPLTFTSLNFIGVIRRGI
jgi:hypothetical protein